jgi:hypothetical protein
MVTASTAGYLVASQFVSLKGLEVPFYVAMCGLAGLVVQRRLQTGGAENGSDPFVPLCLSTRQPAV